VAAASFRVSAPTIGLMASGLPENLGKPINTRLTYPIDIIFLESSKMTLKAALCDEVKGLRQSF
jgi:hypothetical protein